MLSPCGPTQALGLGNEVPRACFPCVCGLAPTVLPALAVSPLMLAAPLAGAGWQQLTRLPVPLAIFSATLTHLANHPKLSAAAEQTRSGP